MRTREEGTDSMKQSKNYMLDLTQGEIFPLMIRFSIPFMFSNGLQILYSLIDTVIVGQFVGKVGLSAVSTSSQIITLMTTICIGLATGGQIYISQLMGANEKKKIRGTVGTLCTSLLLVGIFMMVISIVCRRVFIGWMDMPTASYDGAVSYLLICGGGIIFTYGYNAVSAVLRGMGDSTRPMIFVLIASVMNLILDLLFVGPLQMGAAGAAWATIISQAVSFICSAIYLYKRKETYYLDFKLSSFAVKKEYLKPLIKLGLPLAISNSALTLSLVVVNRFINGYGLVASATYGVGAKVMQFPDILTRSLGGAQSVIVGQNIGAGDTKRVSQSVKSCMILSTIIYAISAVVLIGLAEPIFSIFTSDAEVIGMAFMYISRMALAFPGFVIMMPSNGVIQGIGFTSLSLVLALLDGFVMRIGLCLLFANVFDLGLPGLFTGYALAAYGTAIPSFLYYLSGRWKKRKTLVGA